MFFLKELPKRSMIENYQRQYPEINPDNVENTLTTLRNASLLLRELEEYFAQYGLSQLKFLILMSIDREVDRTSLTFAEVSDRIDVSKPVLSRTINKMIEEDLLNSQSDPNDGRIKHLLLSIKAKNVLRDLLPEYFLLISTCKL